MDKTGKKKILIVDDEESVLENLFQILSRAGYQVGKTTRGKEALIAATNEKPDLIILDIVMPDINGSDVAAVLLKNEQTKHIPIIFLTALLNKSEESRLKKYSSRYFVMAKPIISSDLLELIASILKS